jgi:hypothetical protein
MKLNEPLARSRGLLLETVGEETVVFDRDSKKAYRLNRSAAIVWRHCDGKTSEQGLAGILATELKLTEPAQPIVTMALQRLEALGLMESTAPIDNPSVTRRHVGRKVAVAAALIPLVAVIALPTPAKASSRLK